MQEHISMEPFMFYAFMHNYTDNEHVDCSPQSNTS
jgi:hypothetical protein